MSPLKDAFACEFPAALHRHHSFLNRFQFTHQIFSSLTQHKFSFHVVEHKNVIASVSEAIQES
jgi:type II secretory pathway predicted ATPase ExeA